MKNNLFGVITVVVTAVIFLWLAFNLPWWTP
jgi:hypothetical protein